ncbi:MAG: helix-turn-helix domain-containing protein [Alphaproteobacteria bacterium]|nr:helix-turn-helix domain-containing protein [Alphaproteobacteria bacterium]MCB9696044.1 helix-turn-helix domain-containing protein [Alphaproteobacteria bacterium]
MTAEEAAKRLGVRRQTLYTYASRGWLRAIRRGRRSLYPEDDVEALRLRAAAAGGHEAAAAEAMDWGSPILSSAITSIDPDGPNYRGVPALELAERDTPFERVATLLWTGELAPASFAGPIHPLASSWPDLVPAGSTVGAALLAVVATLGLAEPAGDRRSWVRHLAGALALAGHGDRRGRLLEALRQPTVAAVVRTALGATPDADRWIDRALVACADHELNASAFAARVAGGTGASDAACLAAALATWSGPLHGGMTDRVERGCARLPERDGPIPGFGHRLYPLGDPRAVFLLDDAATIDPSTARPFLELAEQVVREGGEPPTLDLALVALARALGLPPGSGAGLFAVGRSAGWLAQADEQRASERMLRPRAVYRGP